MEQRLEKQTEEMIRAAREIAREREVRGADEERLPPPTQEKIREWERRREERRRREDYYRPR
jgi:hypothetical protein